MDDLEKLYFEKEFEDIKTFCIKHNQMIMYRNRPYYLFDKKIYDKDMNVVIREVENGFSDLFEYLEHFERSQ